MPQPASFLNFDVGYAIGTLFVRPLLVVIMQCVILHKYLTLPTTARTTLTVLCLLWYIYSQTSALMKVLKREQERLENEITGIPTERKPELADQICTGLAAKVWPQYSDPGRGISYYITCHPVTTDWVNCDWVAKLMVAKLPLDGEQGALLLLETQPAQTHHLALIQLDTLLEEAGWARMFRRGAD